MNLLRLKFSVAFQRLEYALKEAGYHRPNSNCDETAAVDWARFKQAASASKKIDMFPAAQQLLAEPPLKQYSKNSALTWEPAGLGGGGAPMKS